VVIVSFSSCKKDDGTEDPNVLSGSTDSVSVPLGTVGNEFSVAAVVGNSSVPVVQTMRIIKNEGGMVTLRVVADLSAIPQLASVISMIPSSMKDASGKLNTDLIFKITSNGIQDQMNKDRALHTMVKYDAAVGDEYKLATSNGKTITRTVTAHSTEDDFSWNWMLIKTITVEQDSRMPGIKKIVYRFNHRFGLVFVEIVPDAGASASAYCYPAKY
jgi:hypothetical protein